MAELILRSGKRAGRRITLAGEAVIGRDEGCRIRLTSSDVSRRHCLLRCDADGDGMTVADLGSRNGTYVNDAAVTSPTRLRPGDLLRVGPFLFQVPSASGDADSDEAISGWLTEEGTEAGQPPPNVKNDTTLVPDVASQGDTTELKLAPAGATGRMAADPPAPPADPVVAQAAAVIREYRAAKKTRR